MVLNNFRIVRLDASNLTFEEYKEVESKRNGETTISTKWARVGGYYGSMERCLKGLKNYIISQYAAIDDYNVVLNKINSLSNAIVSCLLYNETKEGQVRISDEDL